jgi:hypothetical protein
MESDAGISSSPFKPGVLAGKVALITGGGSGIGLEITRQLGESKLPKQHSRFQPKLKTKKTMP